MYPLYRVDRPSKIEPKSSAPFKTMLEVAELTASSAYGACFACGIAVCIALDFDEVVWVTTLMACVPASCKWLPKICRFTHLTLTRTAFASKPYILKGAILAFG